MAKYKLLGKFEKEELKKLMDLLEYQEYWQGGWKYISGGYSTCNYDAYDDDVVYMTLEYGQEGEIHYEDRLEIDRQYLKDLDMTISDKARYVK